MSRLKASVAGSTGQPATFVPGPGVPIDATPPTATAVMASARSMRKPYPAQPRAWPDGLRDRHSSRLRMEFRRPVADTSGWMLRPLALPCVLLCTALLSACGGGSSTGEVQAWKVSAPYLPPPDPASLVKATTKATPAAADATAA